MRQRSPSSFPWQGRGQGEESFLLVAWISATLSAFLRRAGGRFLFVFAFHAIFFRTVRPIVSGQEIFSIDIVTSRNRLARKFRGELPTGLLCEIPFLRFSKGSISAAIDQPSVTVITASKPFMWRSMSRTWCLIDREKLLENWIGNHDAIPKPISDARHAWQIERRERELAHKNASSPFLASFIFWYDCPGSFRRPR